MAREDLGEGKELEEMSLLARKEGAGGVRRSE
jgi:hypothetical protein